MNDDNQSVIPENPFVVSEIEPIDTPEGCEGGKWYRYVISRDGSRIDGLCSGSRQHVSNHAQSVADDLNARVGGRSSSTWTPRQKR